MLKFLTTKQCETSIKSHISSCDKFICATSYIKMSDVDIFTKLIKPRESKSIIVTCCDFGITDPEALRDLLEHGFIIRVVRQVGMNVKLWIFYGSHTTMICGSSNILDSGLHENIEANLETDLEDAIADGQAFSQNLLTESLSFEIDPEWITEYRKLRPNLLNNIKNEPSILPEPAGVIVKVSENLKWTEKCSNKTFLAQGVPTALPKTNKLTYFQEQEIPIKIVLLEKTTPSQNKLYSEFYTKITRNMQITGKSECFGNWLNKVWGFNFTESHKKYRLSNIEKDDGWEKWFSDGSKDVDGFLYEYAIDSSNESLIIYYRNSYPWITDY